MTESGRFGPAGGSSSGTRFLENLAYLVPGYRGYKEKALRHEEDSRFRSRLLAKLQLLSTLLEEHRARLAERSAPASALETIDSRLGRIRSLAEAVRYAPYGFSGFFEADRVREETLERLLEVDLLLFQDLDNAVEMVRAFPSTTASRAALPELLDLLDPQISLVETRLVIRDKVMGDR